MSEVTKGEWKLYDKHFDKDYSIVVNEFEDVICTTSGDNYLANATLMAASV